MNQDSCSTVRPGAEAAKVWIASPTTSTRSMSGSSMVRGRSARMRPTASFTSFSARSLLTSSCSSTSVVETPSATEEVKCFTPATLATASSTLRVTWVSSSAGAAPDWVIAMETMGTSTLGARVIGMLRNAATPSTSSTTNSTMAGIGRRIEAPEMFSAIRSASRRIDRRHPVAVPHEGAGHRGHRLPRRHARGQQHLAAAAQRHRHGMGGDQPVLDHLHVRAVRV